MLFAVFTFEFEGSKIKTKSCKMHKKAHISQIAGNWFCGFGGNRELLAEDAPNSPGSEMGDGGPGVILVRHGAVGVVEEPLQGEEAAGGGGVMSRGSADHGAGGPG